MNDGTKKHHHHLVAGEIVFKQKDHDNIHSVRVNGVLIDPEKEIPVRLLGKAQQILQLNFHQRMQDENIEVLDVVLTNFVYLGHFTQEEFHRVPEGTKLQEKAAQAPAERHLKSVPDLEQAVAEAGDGTTPSTEQPE